MPGTNMNGEVALEDPRYSFQLYLASHGVDVWAMDYRTHFVPPETAQKDMSELAGWTNDLFEGDIDAAAKFVLAQTGAQPAVPSVNCGCDPKNDVCLMLCGKPIAPGGLGVGSGGGNGGEGTQDVTKSFGKMLEQQMQAK